MFLSVVLQDYRFPVCAQLLVMIVIAGRLSLLGFVFKPVSWLAGDSRLRQTSSPRIHLVERQSLSSICPSTIISYLRSLEASLSTPLAALSPILLSFRYTGINLLQSSVNTIRGKDSSPMQPPMGDFLGRASRQDCEILTIQVHQADRMWVGLHPTDWKATDVLGPSQGGLGGLDDLDGLPVFGHNAYLSGENLFFAHKEISIKGIANYFLVQGLTKCHLKEGSPLQDDGIAFEEASEVVEDRLVNSMEE